MQPPNNVNLEEHREASHCRSSAVRADGLPSARRWPGNDDDAVPFSVTALTHLPRPSRATGQRFVTCAAYSNPLGITQVSVGCASANAADRPLHALGRNSPVGTLQNSSLQGLEEEPLGSHAEIQLRHHYPLPNTPGRRIKRRRCIAERNSITDSSSVLPASNPSGSACSAFQRSAVAVLPELSHRNIGLTHRAFTVNPHPLANKLMPPASPLGVISAQMPRMIAPEYHCRERPRKIDVSCKFPKPAPPQRRHGFAAQGVSSATTTP